VRNWRIISSIAAVVFAAIAGILVWKYLSSADSRAEKNKHLVTVLVAKASIQRGTLFDQALAEKLFGTTQIPKDSLPPDVLTASSDAQLLSVYKGKVANSVIFTGTPIVSDEFVSAGQLVSTVSGAIPAGKEAITVSLDQTHAVGGFVTPGDHVNMLLNFPVIDATGAATTHKATAFLLPGLKVMAVGSSTILPQAASPTASLTSGTVTTTTTPQTQPSSLITLQVTPREAEQIVQGTTIGTVWLTLDPPDFSPGQFKSPTEIVDQINMFDQALPELQRRAQNIIQDPPPPSDLP
jgi:Flp pilus assembly protein CpaB